MFSREEDARDVKQKTARKDVRIEEHYLAVCQMLVAVSDSAFGIGLLQYSLTMSDPKGWTDGHIARMNIESTVLSTCRGCEPLARRNSR